MYAIVEIAGQQFKVEKKQEIFVHRLEEKEGAKVEFSEVLLIDNKGKVNVGTPTINGAVVSAKVLEHVQGDKVLVFKKKRRKGYQKLNGHRQQFTKIEISDILEKAPKAAAKPAEKKEETPKAAAKPAAKKEVKKAAPIAETAEKKAAPKAKKPAAKKAAPKPKAETKKAAPAKEAKPKAAPKAKKADEEKKEDK